MIIKARAGKGGQALANYLEGGKNEHAELLELRNIDAPSLKAAIFDMDMTAQESKCQNHALHVQMRAAPGERLSAELWREAVDRYAEAFSMEGHQAAVVLHHQQDGATHCHVVFNRVHPETMKAAHLGHNYATHKTLARQLERDFGLQIVTDHKREKPRDYSNAGMKEQQQAHRAGANVHDIHDQIRGAWEKSDNGQSFSAALEAEGFTLAQGDRRDFVAVDDNGHPYSIGKRTTGASAADVRAKLADLDRDNVPSVQAVKIGLELAAEEELKNEKERKGKGEASAAHAPAPDWNKAQHSNDKPNTFYIDRAAKWEAAAAARIVRLRGEHARQYEQQQQGFDKSAKLETGEAVKEFNDLKRHDETAALLKTQAGELALELQSQQQKRDAFAAVQFSAEQHRAEQAERERGFQQSQINRKLKLSDEVTEETLDEEISRKLKGLLMKGINQANLEHKRELQRLRDPIQRDGNENQQGRGSQSKDKDKSKDTAAPESWMQQSCGDKIGGFNNLSDEHKQAAEKSFEAWRSAGTEEQQANRSQYSLQDYVSYVQKKERERQSVKPEEKESKKAEPLEKANIKANDRAADVHHTHDENADQLRQAEERAQNQAARERQQQARQEQQPEKAQTTSAQARADAEHEAMLQRKIKEWNEPGNKRPGGRKRDFE